MNRLLLLFICYFVYTHVSACTNLIVGKKASADGSVICTYNCDGYAWAGALSFIPQKRHEKGDKVAIRRWNDDSIKGYVDQVDFTHGVIGYINDKQLCIVETTFGGRKELINKEGLLDYDNLISLGLQRASTARQAIKVITDLVEEYGYCDSGETLTLCDKEEAWIMEIIGKGPGVKGAVWVAVRIPDDCICAHANLSRIRQFPLNDKQNCLYAKDVISFARQKGFFSGKDADFSFRDAYCPIDFENVRYADARVWSFFRHHYDKQEMDKYLPYINGDFSKYDHLPLFIKPNKPLSLRDVQADMRDHFEGTPLDMTSDISAGPWGMPVRPLPMTYKANGGKTYFVERPIATQKSGFTLVSQLRSWLPDEIGGIMHYNCDDAAMIAYVPIYCGINQVPTAFSPSIANYKVFNEKCAFWMCNFISNIVYPRYSVMAPDLKDAQKELEDFYENDQKNVEKETADITRYDRINYLTKKSEAYTNQMMERWDKLARLLIVKHNDLIVLPSKDGVIHYKTRKEMKTPGYNQSYKDAIGKITGDRYEMKEVIYREER